MPALDLNAPVLGQPGDSFDLTIPAATGFFDRLFGTQYRVEVWGCDPQTFVVGVWTAGGAPVARNQPGRCYVDFTTILPEFRVEVKAGADGPYTVQATKRAWWQKVFGL